MLGAYSQRSAGPGLRGKTRWRRGGRRMWVVGERQYKGDLLVAELLVFSTSGSTLRRHPEAGVAGEPDRAPVFGADPVVQLRRAALNRLIGGSLRDATPVLRAPGVTQRSLTLAESAASLSRSTDATPTGAPSLSTSNRSARTIQCRQYCSGCIASSA